MVSKPFVGRRAVYGFIDRQDLPGTLRVFDFASPDVTTAQRAETTVPQQLLFQMNSPLVIELASKLAERANSEAGGDPKIAIRKLYHRTFARSPTADERLSAEQFLDAESSTETATPAVGQFTPLQQLAQALLLANEFVFID